MTDEELLARLDAMMLEPPEEPEDQESREYFEQAKSPRTRQTSRPGQRK